MIKNKPFIQELILHRNQEQDPVNEFAVRNKASPLNVWCKFKPFSIESFNNIYKSNIDGVKLKFKNTIIILNGRHKSK